jgi:hypothetical protein
MDYKIISELQKSYRVTEIQEQINSGMAWKLEGSVGRFAMNMLENGVCMLPLKSNLDYYGNIVPARNQLKSGTKGSFQNCANFWQKVYDGDFETIESLEEIFGVDVEDEIS